MTARPILFSGAMVRALLEGRKTQTRRVVKPQPIFAGIKSVERGHWAKCDGAHCYVVPVPGGTYQDNTTNGPWKCPYGQPSDLLWVRETWHCESSQNLVRYRASGDHLHDLKRWKPSIHMPRWASRITLRITEVRVQRLQEISEDDAIKEGMAPLQPGHQDRGGWAVERYSRLWDSLNEKRGYGWLANPWVWAMTFHVINSNVDQVKP